MTAVAYMANKFPSPVEPYVAQEVQALRSRGVTVIPCSVWRAAGLESDLSGLAAETLYLSPIRFWLLMRAAWLCLTKFSSIKDIFGRVAYEGKETPARRVRALAHTWLGAYYALLLEPYEVQHIHAHHGYFASWVGMVAARLLGIGFSVTLHGSDLLVHSAWIDTKLKNCSFCVTISEFNRRYILERYSDVEPEKVVVRRLGVGCAGRKTLAAPAKRGPPMLNLLAVGRLHAVKDHAFLLRACRRLKDRGARLACEIAGEGGERARIEKMIRDLDIGGEVRLLGHLPREGLDACYEKADLVVLTSRSEGIPLVLMEAMARGKPVLAPALSGIPELVMEGETGFLYQPGSIDDFVTKVEWLRDSQSALGPLCRAARQHVLRHFDRETNLADFCDLFFSRIGRTEEGKAHEDPVLQ